MKKKYIIPTATVCNVTADAVMFNTSLTIADDNKKYKDDDVRQLTNSNGEFWGD